jgi:hypothetical protein
MKTALFVALFVASSVFAGHRTVVITTLDTIKITQTFNDTTILVKSDTTVFKATTPLAKPKAK